jgi:hypothetical protein
MARSSSGKSVARAAATGGGTTYRGQMPVNWYAALVIIVVIGLASIAFAKYDYNKTPTVVEPTVGTSWHAGLAFDICGTMEAAIPASSSSATTGLTISGNGVVLVAPKKSSEAGNNATLGKFADGYTGLTLTNTKLKYPSTKVPEYTNGQKCATGTPDAGKVGVVQARSWVISTTTSKNHEEEETGGATTLEPADLKFADRQLITTGFVPEGTKMPKPPASVISGLVTALSSGAAPVATTTTTAAGSTATTAAVATTTTTLATSTTTTKPAATTTTTPSSTTTTK